MATQYTIRAKDSVTQDIYFVTILGIFDPETDLNNPQTNNAPDPDSITIISQIEIAEEFSLKDNYGIQAVTIVPSSLSSFDAVSHDFCDPTTWYQEATVVLGEELATFDNLIFNFANPTVIEYEKIVNNDKVPVNRQLKLYINNIEIDKDSILINNIDYINGIITFNSPQVGIVTADYAYVDPSNPNRSRWTLVPAPESIIAVTTAKIKFSKDITYPSPMTFNIKTNSDIESSVIISSKKYKTLRDLTIFASHWEILPALGEFNNDIVHFVYDYKSSIVLDSANNMSIELAIDDNTPRTGEIGVVTFRCIRIK